ncbi:hypothetical protein DL546_001571 [Coniochaeta pulveracea]|uniref:Histone H1 n=1 Tax=Coniochaeta pulveracea TaxID=177199 RepID=A0A420YCV3_9PEZI|nr:hypothetical protein DL546_001571 [Coniochaeta pulveracea]
MPPKKSETKSEGAAAPKTKSSKSSSNHASYQDMIADAIITLKDRNGSSRQALKKYVRANNNISPDMPTAMFDSLFNRALKAGVEKGVFEQPKGASGGTKLAKKSKDAAAPKKAAPKKEAESKKESAAKAEPKEKKTTATKKAAPKKAAPKKESAATKKEPAAKKAAAPKKATAKKAATKKEAAADAVVDKPTVLSKTKSGRVTKTTASKPATKKAAPKKAAAKKEKTPKKAAAEASS